MQATFFVQSFRRWERDLVWCTDFECFTRGEALAKAEAHARDLAKRERTLTEHGQSTYVRVVQCHGGTFNFARGGDNYEK